MIRYNILIRDDILNSDKSAIRRRNRSRKCLKNSENGIVDFAFKQLLCCFIFLISILLFRILDGNAANRISVSINNRICEENFSIFDNLMSIIDNA